MPGTFLDISQLVELSLDNELYLMVSGSANVSPAFSTKKQQQRDSVLLRIGKLGSLYVSRVGLGWLMVRLLGSA
jgi:hypothetical protein